MLEQKHKGERGTITESTSETVSVKTAGGEIVRVRKSNVEGDGFAPYITPKTSDGPGGTILVLDIPKEAGPGGKVIGDAVRRIVINKTNKKMGAQMSIEEYHGGKKAKHGKTSVEGNWIPASQVEGITKETISVKSFNIDKIAMVETMLTVMSTPSEEIPDGSNRLKYNSNCCGSREVGALCCDDNGVCDHGCFCVNKESSQRTTSQGPGELDLVTDVVGWCCMYCCMKDQWVACNDSCTCCMGCCFEPNRIYGRKGKTDPFDVVAVTKLNLIMAGGLPDFDFTWRIQSVGETETDLQYQLAKEYVGTCQDPTSTARTVANVIHFLNDV